MTTTDPTQAAYQAILDSHWRTAQLAGFALGWNGYSEASDGYATKPPIWKRISYSEETARAFYAGIEDPQELRELAADALASAGWTLRAINWKKS